MKKPYNFNQLEKLVIFIVGRTGEEVWREIPGTDGQYFISDTGEVLSLSLREPRILKPFVCGNGYLYVNILGQNKRVHRLVA
jgi:hypothetical protein